jgi:hypothetical protein
MPTARWPSRFLSWSHRPGAWFDENASPTAARFSRSTALRALFAVLALRPGRSWPNDSTS